MSLIQFQTVLKFILMKVFLVRSTIAAIQTVLVLSKTIQPGVALITQKDIVQNQSGLEERDRTFVSPVLSIIDAHVTHVKPPV